MSVVHDVFTRTCAQCGKEFGVAHPDLWVFKHVAGKNVKYWCSYGCKRAWEKEGENMGKLTIEDREEGDGMIRILADTREATQHWERRCDELPYLLVPMSDGSVIRYNPEIPHPGFVKAIQNIENMMTGYPPERERE